MRLLEFLAKRFELALTVTFLGGVALFLASAFTGTGGDLIGGDAAAYFEYARVLMVEGRLPQEHIKYPCGVALFGLIGYAPAMLGAKAAAGLGIPLSARWETGWALPAQIAYCLPLLALSWVAFRANAGMLIRLGLSERVVKPMILFWIVVTNVGFYVLKEPAMSEGVTYATLSLFYWALVRWFYETPEERARAIVPSRFRDCARRAAIAGVFLGMAGMVRQQNILHSLAVPLLLLGPGRARPFDDAARTLGRRISLVAVCAIASVPFFILPWLAWLAGEGRLVLYSYGEEGFNFASPRLLTVLFHPGYHGLFVFHPAYAIAAAGLSLFFRRHRALALPLLAAIAIQVYLVASWHFLSFGASVGHRGFFTVAPLLLAGWVSAGQWAVSRGRASLLVGAVAMLMAGNAVLTLLVMTNRINSLGVDAPPATVR